MMAKHKERGTDGYSRMLRDLERFRKWCKEGREEDADDLFEEIKEWVISQCEEAELYAKYGTKGGRPPKETGGKTPPKREGETLPKPKEESNELKKEEINQEKTGTVLQLPPGFPSSHDTFDAVLSGGVSEVLAKWRTAWKKWKRTEPSIGNLEYRIASENMDYLKEPDIDKAFKWFLTDENAKEFGGHSFKAFCKDPAKWLGKYRDSLPKDRRDEIAKLEAEQRAEQEKILKRDFEIDPEDDKPLNFRTLI